MGRNLTPRRARGMSMTMMIALKITAERMALSGEWSRITLSVASCGNATMNIAGMMAKYLATSLAMLNVVSAPRVMRSCLPISTISMSLVAVSYTHLRAHETPEHLVCRLLLEKKKTK